MEKKVFLLLLGSLMTTLPLFSQELAVIKRRTMIQQEIKSMIYLDSAFKEPVNKEPNWKKINKTLSQKYQLKVDTILNEVQCKWFERNKECEKYGKAFVTYLLYHSPSTLSSHLQVVSLNNSLYTLVEKVLNKKTLLSAAQLMDDFNARFVELKMIQAKKEDDITDVTKSVPYAGMLDTQAGLYYQGGQVEKALKIQQQAVNITPDNKEMQETLRKMKSGEKLF